MPDEVYEYMKEYGFTYEDIDKMEDINDDVFALTLDYVKRNTSFLEDIGLNKTEVIEIMNKNPFMVTVHKNKLASFDEIFADLGFTKEELKTMLLKNPNIYTASPIELNKTINYIKEKGYDNKVVRNFIYNNPQVIDLYFEEAIKHLKFNQ